MAGRFAIGLILVAVGFVLLLGTMEVLDAGATLRAWWPLAIVLVGVLQAIEQRRVGVGPIIITAVGLVLLGITTDVAGVDTAVIWPLLLIAAGIWFLVRRTPAGARNEGDARISATAIFSDRDLRSSSRHFERAEVTTVFGDLDLDLRDARAAEGGAVIDLTAVFGDVDIFVPRSWRVVMSTSSVFGDIDHLGGGAEAPPEGAPSLRVRGIAVFADVDVRQ